MRRPFLIALFALGTLGGYASGFHHLRYGSSCRWSDRRAEYEQHVADVCARAALDAQATRVTSAPAPLPAAPQAVPVQVAPVVVVPPIQMIAPQVVSAPVQAVPAPAQVAPPAQVPPATAAQPAR